MSSMLTLQRRHSKKCRDRNKGPNYLKCRGHCPLRVCGTAEGRRVRISLKTRDLQRAAKRLTEIEDRASGKPRKTIAEAIEAFHAQHRGDQQETKRKYKRILGFLSEFCTQHEIHYVDRVLLEDMDRYALWRNKKNWTWVLEIAYSPWVETNLIAQIRRLLEASHFTVPVRFRSVAGQGLIGRLFEGGCHAAIGLLPVPEGIGTACILREKLSVALSSHHRLAPRRTIHAPELSDDPVVWVLGTEDSIVSKSILELLRKTGYTPNITHRAQCVGEALGLVREGFGVSIVKSSELRSRRDGVVIRPFAEPYLVVETGLLYLAEHRWEVLKHFIKLVTEQLRCKEARNFG